MTSVVLNLLGFCFVALGAVTSLRSRAYADDLAPNPTPSPSITPKSDFSYDGQAAAAFLSYDETRGAQKFSMREIGLTLKGGIGYRLDPDWDLSANGFYTLIPLNLRVTPEGASSARWYGLNGRISRVIYRPEPDSSLSLGFGYYFWGMTASASSPVYVYGVSVAAGPQVYTIYRSVNSEGHDWSAYLKWASLIDDSGFAIGNREMAVGGAYSPWGTKSNPNPYYLASDLAFVHYRTFDSVSLSVGLSRKL